MYKIFALNSVVAIILINLRFTCFSVFIKVLQRPKNKVSLTWSNLKIGYLANNNITHI